MIRIRRMIDLRIGALIGAGEPIGKGGRYGEGVMPPLGLLASGPAKAVNLTDIGVILAKGGRVGKGLYLPLPCLASPHLAVTALPGRS